MVRISLSPRHNKTACYHMLQLTSQSKVEPKKIDTKGFLTDFGRICHVKWHTKSLPKSDLGKGVICKMASKMSVNILHWLYLNNYSILMKGGVLRFWAQQIKGIIKVTNG